MAVSAEDVMKLREKTGAGLMDCKRALVETNGDSEKATVLLRERGIAKAEKKRSRTANEGIIAHYIHSDTKKGVLLELNCETDFVARNQEFRELARELCMQVAAMSPAAVSREELPQEVVEREKAIYAQQVTDKPPQVVEKIVAGKLEKFYAQMCLLDQPWIRDDKKCIRALIDDKIAKLGEKIEVRRFVRMEVGEGPEDE
jgi:elongation factor Ts